MMKIYVELIKDGECISNSGNVFSSHVIDVYGYDNEVLVWDHNGPITQITTGIEDTKQRIDRFINTFELEGFRILNLEIKEGVK